MRAPDDNSGGIMITRSEYWIRVAREVARRALLQSALAAAGLLTGSAAAGAQPPAAGRLWAAQTGINQVTLAWDSVPGAAQYRLYLGDPSAPGTLNKRPVVVLSGSGRRANLTGLQRAANGITLVAVDAAGGVLKQAPFPSVTPATFYPPATPPTGVTAQATSGSEVVVTWDSVPGATGYVIGRAVHRSGFRMLCAVCPNEARFVDQNVMAGLPHTYTVAAIFPSGDVSRRVATTPVTPGATPVVTAPLTPATGTPTTSPGAPTGTPATTTGATSPGAPTGTSPTTTAGSPPGALPTSTSGYTPPGQPAASIPASTTTTTSGTITHPPTSSTTSTGTSSGTSVPPTATANVPDCQLEYRRADNMWAPSGQPSASLGTETIGLAVGQKKVFITDWKYEKMRNDGTTYYGSHLRIATNRSGRMIRMTIRGFDGNLLDWSFTTFPVGLAPNATASLQHDLVDVSCP